MRAAIDELTVRWETRGETTAPGQGGVAGAVRPAGGTYDGAPAWRSQVFVERDTGGTGGADGVGRTGGAGRTGKRRATRYERFTTRMVLVSSVLMLAVTAGLHVFNYSLETKTSSTSGTHGGFYKDGE